MTFGSLFTGAGGFDLGFEKAGFQCAWQCEIDRTASEVLRHRWPDVPKFDDVRACGKNNLSDVDILVGGFPCQDLSVAGNRGGLAGERSGLFYELARIARELRPGFLVWENVPGLLSSDDGRDFARVLRHLGDIGYRGAWRVLDAQHFGVPQQRRRVFGVFARGRFGVERCAEILALSEGMRGNSPKGREEGAEVAGTITGRARQPGGDEAAAGRIVFGGGRGERRGNATLTTENQRNDFDNENFVMSYRTAGDGAVYESGGKTAPLTTQTDPNALIVMQCHGSNVGPMGTLRSGHGDVQSGVPFMCVPIDMRQASRGGTMTNNRKEGTTGGAPGTGIREDGDPSPTIAVSHPPAVGLNNTVRRLTPRECERLQGWPDDHTRYGNGGREIADGPRYRMIGNGVAMPCAEWIGRRLMEVSA